MDGSISARRDRFPARLLTSHFLAAAFFALLLSACGLPQPFGAANSEASAEPEASADTGENVGTASPARAAASKTPENELLPPAESASGDSDALVADALRPPTPRDVDGPAAEPQGTSNSPADLAAERERLAAEREAQERRRAELEARERELAERERRLAEQRAAERAAERATQEEAAEEAAALRRQREAEELRQQAQAAELARAEAAQSATDEEANRASAERSSRSERARVIDQPSETITGGSEPYTAQSETASRGEPNSGAVEPPTQPPAWSGDEAWRSGRSDTADTSSGASAYPSAREAAQRLRPGTRFEVEITQTISSASAQLGDPVVTQLIEDIVDARGNVLVAAGTELRGTVTEVRPLRKVGGRAALGVVIDRIVLPSGDAIEIRASLQELGKDKRSDKFRIAGAAVAGAILGGIFGDAEGAVAGAAAGAAAGTAAVARAKGEDVELPAGLALELELEEIVTVHEEIGGVVQR